MRADHTFQSVLDAGLQPAAILLPVLGILAVTSEWSQRTGLITFVLVPVRSRVLGAKLIASLLLAVAMLAMSVAVVAAGVFVPSPGVEGTLCDAAPLIGQSAVNLTAGMVVASRSARSCSPPRPPSSSSSRCRCRGWRCFSLPVFSGVAPWVDYASALGQMTVEVDERHPMGARLHLARHLDGAAAPGLRLADHAAGDRLVKTLRRSAFDWSAGRSKGAPQLVLSAGGRRIDTQATGIGGGPQLRQSARLPRRASVSARSPETPAWDEERERGRLWCLQPAPGNRGSPSPNRPTRPMIAGCLFSTLSPGKRSLQERDAAIRYHEASRALRAAQSDENIAADGEWVLAGPRGMHGTPVLWADRVEWQGTEVPLSPKLTAKVGQLKAGDSRAGRGRIGRRGAL